MSVQFTLTDEQDDTLGYKRLKMTPANSPVVRSDTASLVQAVTSVTAADTKDQITRQATGTPVYGDKDLAWITEPLDGTVEPSTGNWTIVLWGFESLAGDHYGFEATVKVYHNGAETGTVVDLSQTTPELGTSTGMVVLSGAATVQTMVAGDRLALRIYVIPVGGSTATGTATLSYNGLLQGADGDSYAISPDNFVSYKTIPTNTITQVLNLLEDESNNLVSSAEVQKAISDALKRYSMDRQRLDSQYYSGDADSFIFPLPRNWIWTFSDLIEIEYPCFFPENNPSTAGISQTRNLDEVNKREDWEIVESAINNQPTRTFWTRTFIPDSGTNNLCLRYTTRHRHDTLVDTIPPDDFQAFCWLSAAYAANIIASRFARISDPSIQADVADYRSRHDYWSKQAAEFMALYDDHIRGEEPPAQAVSANSNWDTNLSFYNLDRLTHPRRWR